MEIIIIFINQKALLEIFFPLAALIKSLPKTKIHLVPASPDWLGNQGNVSEAMAEIKEYLGPGARMSSPLFHILGIGSKNQEDDIALLKFAAYNATRIKSWIGKGFSPTLTEDLKLLGIPLTPQVGEESLLQALERLGVNVWDYLKKSDDLWRSSDARSIFSDPYAGRYLKVFHVLDVMRKNHGEDDSLEAISLCMMELTSGRNNPYISSLVSTWERMEDLTRIACDRMDDEHPAFKQTKKMGRPVGYVDLGEVSDYVDYQSILDCAAKRFPHLAIVKYELGAETYIRAHSEIFEIRVPQGLQDTEKTLRTISQIIQGLQETYN